MSIDNHKLWIYAADGQLVVPQEVDAVSVSLGERFQVFVKSVFLGHHLEILLIITFVRLDQTPGDYIVRISANVFPQKISGYAGQSHCFENGYPRALISITSPFIQASLQSSQRYTTSFRAYTPSNQCAGGYLPSKCPVQRCSSFDARH